MPEYIEFRESTIKRAKTRVWDVASKSSGAILGRISWYGAWRQYVFFPAGGSLYSAGCLNDLASFIRERMAERRKPPVTDQAAPNHRNDP